jgi:hypothetical protein
MEAFLVALGYLWRVVSNLIQLLVVLYIFSKLKTPFEVIVVAVLGLIYTTVRTMGFGNFIAFTNLGKGLDQEFIRLRRLLGDQTVQEHEAEVSEQNKRLKRLAAKAGSTSCLSRSFFSFVSFSSSQTNSGTRL